MMAHATEAPQNPLLVLQQRVFLTAQAVTDAVQGAIQAGIQVQVPRQLARPARARQHGKAIEEVVLRVHRHVPSTAAEESLRGKSAEVLLTEAARRERCARCFGGEKSPEAVLSGSELPRARVLCVSCLQL